MKNLNFCVALTSLFLMAACGILPKASPQLVQHDLGGGFRSLAQKPLPLRQVTVSATPVVAGLNMNYREASRPTTRGAYTFNRWAAPPANLLDQALARLLPIDVSGRCRLNFLLSDFLLEIDESGTGAVLLAGSLRLSLDGKNAVYKRIVDIRVPVDQIEPAGLALGERKAAIQLAELTSSWMSGEIEVFCKG